METVRVGVSGRQPVDLLPCLSPKARPAYRRYHRIGTVALIAILGEVAVFEVENAAQITVQTSSLSS